STTTTAAGAGVGAGGAGAGAAASVIHACTAAVTSSTSTSPSPPNSSIEVNNARTTSTIRNNASATCGVITCAPSRNRDNNDSPTCVTRSKRLNAKNPDVPLIV